MRLGWVTDGGWETAGLRSYRRLVAAGDNLPQGRPSTDGGWETAGPPSFRKLVAAAGGNRPPGALFYRRQLGNRRSPEFPEAGRRSGRSAFHQSQEP